MNHFKLELFHPLRKSYGFRLMATYEITSTYEDLDDALRVNIDCLLDDGYQFGAVRVTNIDTGSSGCFSVYGLYHEIRPIESETLKVTH